LGEQYRGGRPVAARSISAEHGPCLHVVLVVAPVIVHE
jgi:hypothetical protein